MKGFGNLQRKLGKVKRLKGEFEASMDDMTEAISDFVEFDCSVTVVDGDGIVITKNDDAFSVAPATDCLDAISRNGILTEEEFNTLRI